MKLKLSDDFKRETAFFLCMLIVSACFIGLLSKSSPIYPMNDWPDVDCYHTMAKSMLDGKIMYRDAFDHKGPYLYFIFAAACILSKHSFLGLCLIEIIALALSLYIIRKLLKLTVKNEGYIGIVLIIYAFIVTTSKAFSHGGSAEELCLPLVLYAIYYFARLLDEGSKMRPLHHIINGVCICVLFFIKYNFLGVYIGGYLAAFFCLLIEKRIKELPEMIGYTLLGFFGAAIPVAFYFGFTGAFPDLWNVYFYDNIFVYVKEATLSEKFKYVFETVKSVFTRYKLFTALCIIGVVRDLCTKRWKNAAINVSCFVFGALGIYFGGRGYIYYALMLFPYAAVGLEACAWFLENCVKIKFEKINVVATVIIVQLVCVLIYSHSISPNSYLLEYEKDDMPQYKFAKIINSVDNSTMLNYGFLDGGFYYAAEKVPANKYYYRSNLTIPEMIDEQNDIVNNKKVDFIVTRRYPLEKYLDIDNKYRLISEESFVIEGYNYTYYLYERI